MRPDVRSFGGPKVRLALRLAFWSCVAAVAALALRAPVAESVPGWDKANHLLAFGVLGLLGLLSWPHRARQVLVGLLAYGAVIELLQSLTPERQASWPDMAANLLGLLLGWSAARWLLRWRA